MLKPDAIEDAAARFVAARQQKRALPGLPPHCAPRSLDDAYAIQEAFVRRWGPKVIGYKIGCSSKRSQALVKATGPIVGRLFEPTRFASPAEISPRDFFMIGVEAEFAFVMGADLPARGTEYDRATVAAAVASVVPAIEICDTRLADWKAAGLAQIVADNAFHGGVVAGRPVDDWRGFDLGTHEAVLSIDGTIRGRGTGALVLGHPLDALAWLANELSRCGHGLGKGDLVAAGTCTGLHFATPGATVAAEFGTLGSVQIRVGS